MKLQLIGPFSQLLALDGLPLKGALQDEALRPIAHAGLVVEGEHVRAVGNFEELHRQFPQAQVEQLQGQWVCMPGLIDAHTHICFAGSRARDYALRSAGKSYLEIARAGGGIWSTVTHTRAATQAQLEALTRGRALRLLQEGITTIEVKSGYALNVEGELNMLRVVAALNRQLPVDLIPTCLAAHIRARDFEGTEAAYLNMLLRELLPRVKAEGLAARVDIFVESGAFSVEDARPYLQAAARMGFALCIHADQFSTGGSALAIELGACSADHLEASGPAEIAALAKSGVVAVALPGCSLGLGVGYAPARRLLDQGACLALASDWNPGSAPMGDLLLQAAVMGMAEKLSTAEVLAAMTFRAAAALRLPDRGRLQAGMLADFIAFPCNDYREILYHQGKMKPAMLWKRGKKINSLLTGL